MMRKKAKLKTAQQAAGDDSASPDHVSNPPEVVETDACGAAGRSPGLGGAPEAGPALAPEKLTDSATA